MSEQPHPAHVADQATAIIQGINKIASDLGMPPIFNPVGFDKYGPTGWQMDPGFRRAIKNDPEWQRILKDAGWEES